MTYQPFSTIITGNKFYGVRNNNTGELVYGDTSHRSHADDICQRLNREAQEEFDAIPI